MPTIHRPHRGRASDQQHQDCLPLFTERSVVNRGSTAQPGRGWSLMLSRSRQWHRTPPSRCATSPISSASRRGQGRTFPFASPKAYCMVTDGHILSGGNKKGWTSSPPFIIVIKRCLVCSIPPYRNTPNSTFRICRAYSIVACRIELLAFEQVVHVIVDLV